MPKLEISRDRTLWPPSVPPSAVEERVVHLDGAGDPVDRDVATRLVATYYDADGSPVWTVEGTFG